MFAPTRPLLALLAAASLLTACTRPADVNAPQVDMGNFRLGYNVVVVNDPQVLPFSRKASDDEWKAALTDAVARRFGAYEGDKYYHIGIKLDGYALAVAGVPLVFTPKSALVITVNIWDDAAQKRLNEEPKAFTVFEGTDSKTLISSGLLQSKQEQMTRLSDNAAKMIQDWILEHPEWIGLPAADGTAAEQPADAPADQTADPAAASGTEPAAPAN